MRLSHIRVSGTLEVPTGKLDVTGGTLKLQDGTLLNLKGGEIDGIANVSVEENGEASIVPQNGGEPQDVNSETSPSDIVVDGSKGKGPAAPSLTTSSFTKGGAAGKSILTDTAWEALGTAIAYEWTATTAQNGFPRLLGRWWRDNSAGSLKTR